MPHPDEETLAGLALGEEAPSRQIASHVTGCPQCTSEVAALRRVAVLAHGATSAADVVPPPPGLWNRVAEEIDAGEAVDDLTAARVRRASGEGPAAPRQAGEARRRPWWWAIGGAVAGVVVGLGGGWALWNQPEPAPTVIATTVLDTLDTREDRGAAQVLSRGEGVALTVRTEPFEAGRGYLEVWLINRDLKRMISVGVLQQGAEATTFPIDRRLLEEGYVIVDISREGFDDRPQHSGDSVVRGTLPL